MAEIWVLIWVMTSFTAYFLTEAACLWSREFWDRPTKEFAAICSILFGPVYLIIAAELAVLALIGTGLTKSDHKTSRD